MGKVYKTGKDTWEHNQKLPGSDEWHRYLGPCPHCGARTFDYGGGWRCVRFYNCFNSVSNHMPSVGPRPSWWDGDTNVFMDGDAWCATKDGFINLQESKAGFGKTPKEAVAQLEQQ